VAGFRAIGDLLARKAAPERQIFRNRRPNRINSPSFFANIVYRHHFFAQMFLFERVQLNFVVALA
jgi:hypothetical protein